MSANSNQVGGDAESDSSQIEGFSVELRTRNFSALECLPQEPISSLCQPLALILRNYVDVTACNYDMRSQDINPGQEGEVRRY